MGCTLQCKVICFENLGSPAAWGEGSVVSGKNWGVVLVSSEATEAPSGVQGSACVLVTGQGSIHGKGIYPSLEGLHFSPPFWPPLP